MESVEVRAEKFEEMMLVMNQWIENLHSDKKISGYFRRHHYKNIALYGTSFVSQRIQEELEGSDIHIQFVFDKDTKDILEKNEKKIDVIVVTSFYYFYEIYLDLSKMTDIPIVGADEVIYVNV